MPFQVDPEVIAVRDSIVGKQPERPVLAIGDVETRRKNVGFLFSVVSSISPAYDDVSSTDYYTSTSDGHQLMMRWYAKKDSTLKDSSAMLYIHGGGYIALSVPTLDKNTRRYVSETGVPILAVEYRLAPEFPYPTPLNDSYDALLWLHNKASKLGLDTNRIAVMGDSAGGGLAASLTHLLKERPGAPRIAKQILIYPMLDDRNTTPDPAFAPFMTWNYNDNATGWQALLSPLYASNAPIPPTAAPGRMTLEQARGLPDLFVDIGELDIFRDEVVKYVEMCLKAGVSTELHLWRGVYHGWDLFGDAEVTRRAREERYRAIRSIGVAGGGERGGTGLEKV